MNLRLPWNRRKVDWPDGGPLFTRGIQLVYEEFREVATLVGADADGLGQVVAALADFVVAVEEATFLDLFLELLGCLVVVTRFLSLVYF